MKTEGIQKMPSSMSEDALFKALLKNKPPVVQKPQAPIKKEVVKPQEPPAPEKEIAYKIEIPVERNTAQSAAPLNPDAVTESIKSLTASVNMMYGLMKTIIVPVLVLILIVGIAILVKK